MSDEVVFQEEQANTVSNISIVRGAPKGMLAWLVKNQVVKNAKQGEYVLLGVAVVAIVLAIGIYLLFGTTHPRPPIQSIPSSNDTPINASITR